MLLSPVVFDLEFDSLDPTKIHVLSYANIIDNEVIVTSTNDYDEIKMFLLSEDVKVIAGHNIIQFDIPAVERVLNISISKTLYPIDTMGLSWYLYPERDRHSLDSLSHDILGQRKVEIKDWTGLSYEEYKNRCEQDVRLNMELYKLMIFDFLEIYGDIDLALPCIERITFKMTCLNLQRESRWKVDIDKATKNRDELIAEKQRLTSELERIMPKIPVKKVIEKPEVFYKKDNTISASGYTFLKAYYGEIIPPDELHRFTGTIYKDDNIKSIEVIGSYKEPNAVSVDQVKNWLKTLGWKPDKFNMKFNKVTGEKTFVEAILDKDKKLTASVKKLAKKTPEVYNLEKIGTLTNRIGTLNSFIEDSVNGYVIAGASAFTNTLRLKHRGVVNLPKTKVPYGDKIRECLISEDGFELVEADMSSLENTTRNHFIYDLDPEYVKSMSSPDFDSHLDLAITAKLMTKDEEKFYKYISKNK